MTRCNQLLLLCLVFLGLTFADKSANAATGSLDTTFGQGGITITTLTTAGGGNSAIPLSVQLQSDGKILVLVDVVNGATATSNVLRYSSTGALDTTFGSRGIAVLPSLVGPASMTLQPNGQIVVSGISQSQFDVERLNADGNVDNSFGNSGVASASLGNRSPGTQLVALVETDGNILVVGQLEPAGRGQSSQVLLARFTPAGALDDTFGANGTTIATALSGVSALAELSTGSILVVNAQTVAQFTFNGRPEPTTGGAMVANAGSGFLTVPTVFQPNGDHLIGQILFAGPARARNASTQVLRFSPIGGADSAFANPSFHYAGNGGSGIEAFPDAMAVQPNGDILVVGSQLTQSQSGSNTVNGLARLTPGGTLDPTFGANGTAINSVPGQTLGLVGVVIQRDGKIVTIGMANNYTALTVSRYLGQ